MTSVRAVISTRRRAKGVDRPVAGNRLHVDRAVPRPIRTLPPLRAPEPPHGPSHRDVARRWEELEWWSCAYCDRSFGRKVVAEVDHVRPLAKGGVHEWFNLAPACRDCNRLKSDADVGEFLAVLAGQAATA